MAIEIRVPTLGELITEATVGKWFKKAGDSVSADEPLVELETDKVTLEVNAPSAGVLSEIVGRDRPDGRDRRAAWPGLARSGHRGRAGRRRQIDARACGAASCGRQSRARRNDNAAGAGRGQDRSRGQD